MGVIATCGAVRARKHSRQQWKNLETAVRLYPLLYVTPCYPQACVAL